MQKSITLETALARSSNQDELQDMINRGGAAGGGTPQRPPTPYAPAKREDDSRSPTRRAESGNSNWSGWHER